MEEDNSIKSKVKKVKMKTFDVASLEIRKPVRVRVRNRVKEIQKLTRARHEKVMYSENSYEWLTFPPEEFLASLKVSISNGVGTIVWETYEKNAKGDKKYITNEVTNPETGKRMISSVSTRIGKRYIEKIAKFAPIDVEVQNATEN